MNRAFPAPFSVQPRIRFSRLLLCVSLLPSLLLTACGGGAERASEVKKVAANAESRQNAAKAPEIKIVEHEPTLRGSNSVVGGVVQNVSAEKIENLSLELELTRRDEGDKEVREVKVVPTSLAPGEEGKYSVTISNREWGTAKILRVKSDSRPDGLAFTSQPGAKRPPERLPEGKIIVVQKPKPKGEEFLNSPDAPDPIR